MTAEPHSPFPEVMNAEKEPEAVVSGMSVIEIIKQQAASARETGEGAIGIQPIQSGPSLTGRDAQIGFPLASDSIPRQQADSPYLVRACIYLVSVRARRCRRRKRDNSQVIPMKKVAVVAGIHRYLRSLYKAHLEGSLDKSARRDHVSMAERVCHAVSRCQHIPPGTQQHAGTLEAGGARIHEQAHDAVESPAERRDEVHGRPGRDDGEERTHTPDNGDQQSHTCSPQVMSALLLRSY